MKYIDKVINNIIERYPTELEFYQAVFKLLKFTICKK